MSHEKAGKRGTRDRGRYQMAQSLLDRLQEPLSFKDILSDFCERLLTFMTKTNRCEQFYELRLR